MGFGTQNQRYVEKTQPILSTPIEGTNEFDGQDKFITTVDGIRKKLVNDGMNGGIGMTGGLKIGGSLESLTIKELGVPLEALTAKTTLTRVAQYGVDAVVGTGSVGLTTAGTRYLFLSGQQDRIRQNGNIVQIKVCLAALNGTTNLYFRVMRLNGTKYDIVAQEDVFAQCSAGVVNTITLATPIAALEGDFISWKIVTNGAAGSQFNMPTGLSVGHAWKYSDSASANNNQFDWNAVSNNTTRTIPTEIYMVAPQVVFIGDSIIAGHPAHFAFTEPTATTSLTGNIEYQLNLLRTNTYQNMGIGSQTTANILARFATDVLALNPRVVVLNGGVNDIALSVTYATFIANWIAILDLIKRNGLYGVICGIAPWTNGTNAQMQTRDIWNAALQALCATYPNITYINLDSALGQNRASGDVGNLWDIIPAMNADNVHFNATGYAAYAAAINTAIVDYVRIGNATDNTVFERDGSMKMNGAATMWDDMRVVPGSFDRPGVSDPVIVSYAPNGGATGTYLWEFDKDDVASFTIQLPHGYKVGSDLYAHIHWTPGARGNEENGNKVGWKIDYTWANISGNFGSMATLDLSDACDGTDHKHQMTDEVAITGSGKHISSMLLCNIRRTDTGTDDTWATNTSGNLPLLLEIDFHYEVDTIGSRSQSLK